MAKLYSYPLSPVFYRKLTRTFPKIVRGRGCWLFDEHGKSYLDASGGAFVANLGHGLKELGGAVGRQIGQVAYVNGTAFTNEPVEALAAELADLCPGDLNKSYFLSSGSEAIEAACKLARQYWVEKGQPKKHKIISATPGYHGNTLLALSTSARGHYKTYFHDWLLDIEMIRAPYPYRCGHEGSPREAEPDCPVCNGTTLETMIKKCGPKKIAAFLIEPIGGSSTGASAPHSSYFKNVRRICDKYGVLWIDDEVLTGAGRTGAWTAVEQFGAVPDILVLGKGLSGGTLPLSAVVTSKRILDPIAKGSGALLHAQTFSHTPAICAAGLAAVRYMRKHGLIDRARTMGKVLQEKLASLLDLSAVGDVRGRGLLTAVEFVSDKENGEPFDRKIKFAERFTENALRRGLVVWPNVGHITQESGGASRGDIAMIAPPFIIAEKEIDELVTRFSLALDDTLKETKTHDNRHGKTKTNENHLHFGKRRLNRVS